MRNTDYFKRKKITVVGFARSGLACANLLDEIGANVSVTDIRDNAATRLNASQLRSKNVNLELGRHTREFIEGRDLVVVSPGVEDTSSAIIWARELKIPVVSEIEIAAILCSGTIIAVTGSNGKTTVTTLIAKILQAKGKKVFILGNIGNPFCGEVNLIKPDDFVSLEVSSFQLENIKSFKPRIAVILNFSHNHLDRYRGMQEYLQAKKRIFLNQDNSDYLVLNSADPALTALAQEAKSRVVYFAQQNGLNPNQSAVLTVGSLLGVEEDLSLEVFAKFKGIEHRLEEVAEINQIKFINDSKATTPVSCIWALNDIPGPVILIAGGKDKGLDYHIVLDLARKKVKVAILIGEAKKKIGEVFRGQLSFQEADTLEEAVSEAYSKAVPGDVVLLSPMCASYDMFSDYEERGRVFKKAVFDLASAEGGSACGGKQKH